MRRLSATTLGTLATVAVVLVLVLGIGLVGFGPRAAAPAAPRAAAAHALAPLVAHPAQFVGGTPPTVTITNLTTFPAGPIATPATVSFNVTVGNVAPVGNYTLSINVTFMDQQTRVVTNTIGLTFGLSNASGWSFPVSGANVIPDLLGAPGVGQPYVISVFVAATNLTNLSLNAPNATANAVNSTFGNFVFPPATPPSVTLTYTSEIHGLYVKPPLTENFTISVTGTTISAANVSVWVTYILFVGGGGSVVAIQPLMVADDQTQFSFQITNSSASNGTLPVAVGGLYQIQANVAVVNPASAASDPTNSTASSSATLTAYLIFAPINGGFVAPAVGHYVGLGNVTVVIRYGGDFVANANVTIFKGGPGGGVVYASPTFQPGPGNHTVAGINPWVVSSTGTYYAVLSVNASYTTNTFSEYINVSASSSGSGQVVYVNTSHYQNSSLIPGLSTAAGGTLLLVIGLIVGLLVALVLGRMMFGQPKAAPAQQWQPKPGTNECSVCHQQFPTEDALKEHQKTAHGMG